MQQIMGDVEQIVRAHPDQWYMFRRMWPRPARPSRGRARTRARRRRRPPPVDAG